MFCYRDRSYCGSKKHKPDCARQFVADEAYWEWSKDIGMPDGGPVAYMDFCSEAEERLKHER